MNETIVKEENWGRISGGRIAKRFTLSNGDLSVSLIDYGASVQRIVYRGMDMALSLPEASLYEKFRFGCIGATVGRYAGRVAEGRFCIDGTEYRLTRNHKGNHMHGGEQGFNTKLWEGRITDNNRVQFTLISPDGEEGYPGNLEVSVTYSLSEGNRLEILFGAVSDRDTIINLTNHCYFNPNGIDTKRHIFRKPPATDNRDTELFIEAERVLELGDNGLPTGKLLPVDDTSFDFRTQRPIAGGAYETPAGGYDHTFALCGHNDEEPVAVAKGVKSGVSIGFFTDQPAVQLYTMGNPGNIFALEAQRFPDSPNHSEFPSAVLRAGEKYSGSIAYVFSYR